MIAVSYQIGRQKYGSLFCNAPKLSCYKNKTRTFISGKIRRPGELVSISQTHPDDRELLRLRGAAAGASEEQAGHYTAVFCQYGGLNVSKTAAGGGAAGGWWSLRS
ncbi:MAG: hypothetical protein Q7N95_17745 [Alphaproteobacteria bacterium]|nr:hypothetical protein [Alphaproteobacteria bacterium]